MLYRTFTGSAVLALALAIPTISTAQTTPQQQWSTVTTTQIKPEFRAEYEAAQKEITAAYKKAGVPYRLVVQTLYGDMNEYVSVAPLAKFADLDGPTVLVKALGEAGAQKMLKRVTAYTVSMHRTAVLDMPDISIETTGDPGEYVHVAVYRLLPGKAEAFTTFMKNDYLPAMKKAGVTNFWVNRPIFGGDLNERLSIRPMHKLAELDGGPLTTKALGADGARQLGIKQAAIVESVKYSLMRIRSDLSLMPAPPKSTN